MQKLLEEQQRLRQRQALDSKVPVPTRPVDPPPVDPTTTTPHQPEEPAHEEGFKTPHTNGHKLPGSPHGPLPPSPTSPGCEDDVAALPVGGSVGEGAEVAGEGVVASGNDGQDAGAPNGPNGKEFHAGVASGNGQDAGAPNGPNGNESHDGVPPTLEVGDDVQPTIPGHEDELPRPDLSKDPPAPSDETGKVPESRPVATPARSCPPGDSIHTDDYTLRSWEDAQVLTLKADRKHKNRLNKSPMPEVTPSDPYFEARTLMDSPSYYGDDDDTQHIFR